MIRLSENNGGVFQNVDKVVEKVHMRGKGEEIATAGTGQSMTSVSQAARCMSHPSACVACGFVLRGTLEHHLALVANYTPPSLHLAGQCVPPSLSAPTPPVPLTLAVSPPPALRRDRSCRSTRFSRAWYTETFGEATRVLLHRRMTR